MNLHWECTFFDELSPLQLYSLLQLRSAVFVVEQTCVFLDMDDKDQYCHHVLGWDGDRLAACSRIVPKNISYDDVSIGRIATASFARNSGIGKLLVQKSIEAVEKIHDTSTITIGAQLYLKRFYNYFGFEQVDEMYLEDGIPHIKMRR